MITEEDYISRSITDQMVKHAEIKVELDIQNNPKLKLNQFGSERNRLLYGYIGQEMTKDYLGETKDQDTFEFDIIYRKRKIEIKSISCKFMPPADYWGTVNSPKDDGMRKQKADHYLFTRIKNDKLLGWLIGYIPCKKFWELGEFVKKGTKLTKDISFIKANGTVLKYKHLYPIRHIKEIKEIILDKRIWEQQRLWEV